MFALFGGKKKYWLIYRLFKNHQMSVLVLNIPYQLGSNAEYYKIHPSSFFVFLNKNIDRIGDNYGAVVVMIYGQAAPLFCLTQQKMQLHIRDGEVTKHGR